MRKLYHHWLSPFSRKVRILLKEKGLDFQLEVEKTWERREDFLALNPAGLVPVLVEHDGHVLAESQAICEYLDEVYPNKLLIGFDPATRAETRRLVRSEEHTSELQSLMRSSYAVVCLKYKNTNNT